MAKKGFTLVELLIVIAIVAVLSVVVVLTLNPAELLKQARDSNRISDLTTLKSAISMYLSDGQTALDGGDGYANCYADGDGAVTADCTSRFSSATVVTSTSRAINGTGWLPVNFAAISSGAPISQLPTDPIHNITNYYAYMATSSNYTFELNAELESNKYTNTSNAENADGGNTATLYEVGTFLSF